MALLELAFIDKFKPLENKRDKFIHTSTIHITLPGIEKLPLMYMLEPNLEGFYKVKDQATVNLFIAMVPKGISRSITLLVMCSSDRKNIVFDTSKLKQTYVKITSIKEKVSESLIYKIVGKLVKLKWIRKLNKYQYMVNPYYSVRNDISATRITQLQLFWNRWDNGYKQTAPIEWPSEEFMGESHKTIEDLKKDLYYIYYIALKLVNQPINCPTSLYLGIITHKFTNKCELLEVRIFIKIPLRHRYSFVFISKLNVTSSSYLNNLEVVCKYNVNKHIRQYMTHKRISHER